MLTAGNILKTERLKKNLTLEQIEKITKVRKKNLEAIEEGDWKSFSSKIYIIGIINTYGSFLGLDTPKLIAFFRREYEKIEEHKFKQKVNQENVTPQKKKNVRLIIALVAFLFIFYFSYQIKIYLSPPQLDITSPTQSTFTVEDKIQLKGIAEKEAIVNVNGERVYLDDNNSFSTMIPLNQKVNKVVIEATGANGRKTKIVKEYLKKLN